MVSRNMFKFAIVLVILVCASSAALSQTPSAVPAGPTKIGIVDPRAFLDDKPGAGLTRLKTAFKTLDDEFRPMTNAIQSNVTKYRAVAAEIERLRGVQGTSAAVLQAKAIEGQDLEKEIKRGEEDMKLRYERRYEQLVAPVYREIFGAMNDYAKQKGFAIILNGPKLEEDELLMGFDDRYNITADFITFFNARPPARTQP